MQRRFDYVFEDEGPTSLTYETSAETLERAEVAIEHGTPVLYVNHKAAEVLAKILAKLALGVYQDGFHIHVPKNLDDDEAEALRIVLVA